MRIRHRIDASLAALALLALASCGGAEVEHGNGFNLVLISLDSTRRDLLSTYGRRPALAPELATSPNLDALGAQGVVMLEASSTSSWTLPAHLSLLSGQPELVHAVDMDYLRLEGGHPLLAEVLRANGYRTAGFYSGPYLEPRFGFGRGFERYEACYGPELADASERHAQWRRAFVDARAAGDAAGAQAAFEAAMQADEEATRASHRDVSSRVVVDAAIGELEAAARDERPFFLFAHLFDPHYDYAPPAPHDRSFDPSYAGELTGEGYFHDPRVSVVDEALPAGRRRVVGERDLAHLVALYEGELAWTDAQLGRLLDRIEELGLSERTLVVVTADHGEEFFEHGSIGHRRTLFEEVLAVPLVLRLPGVLPARRVAGVVSTIDVYATALELLGLRAPDGLASRSFLARIDGASDPVERGALGRVVTQSWRNILLDGRVEPLRCKQLRVTESFRLGSIKITRERSWPEADVPGTEALLAPLREAERRRETLAWIDLARAPRELPEEHSSDFSDPRAASALRAFHERYGELLALRREARLRARDEPPPAGLRGLGYAGDEAPAAPGASELFRLPPPGERILSGGR